MASGGAGGDREPRLTALGDDVARDLKARLKAKGPQTGELDPLFDRIAKEFARGTGADNRTMPASHFGQCR